MKNLVGPIYLVYFCWRIS